MFIYYEGNSGVHAKKPAVIYYEGNSGVHAKKPAVIYYEGNSGVHAKKPAVIYYEGNSGVHAKKPAVIYYEGNSGVHVLQAQQKLKVAMPETQLEKWKWRIIVYSCGSMCKAKCKPEKMQLVVGTSAVLYEFCASQYITCPVKGNRHVYILKWMP